MVCRLSLDKPIGHFGDTITVMNVHMHNNLANNLGPGKLQPFGQWIYDLCKQYEVDVLMGDFNMSFFRVIPEFRSRGANIDLAASYFWRTEDGVPAADSCGIFRLGKPGEYKLEFGPDQLPAFLKMAAVADDKSKPIHVHKENGGPGQPLVRFLPKGMLVNDKVAETLRPSFESGTAVTALQSAPPHKSHGILRIQEKWMDVNLWRIGGANYKGSHFPVVFFTKNPGRRSPDAADRRRRSQNQKTWGQGSAAVAVDP